MSTLTPDRKGHTPRRVISMTDEMWADLCQLAKIRHTSASQLIRVMTATAIDNARADGELPTPRKRRTSK